MREFVESKGDRIVLDYLPAYAPELNPVEYVWGYLRLGFRYRAESPAS